MKSETEIRNELANVIRHYADCGEWLEKCPFADGQAFSETAGMELEEMEQNMVELATHVKDESIAESVGCAIDGELGDFDEPAAFWRYLADIIERG